MKCPHCGKEISENQIMPVIISTGEEFEQFLCDRINARDGMECEKTKASGDQGVDLIVRVADKKIAIQCKLYSEPVGNSAVQEVVAGRIMYKCDLGCVVTNSTFTNSAKELASATKVELLSYKDIFAYLDAMRLNGDVDSEELIRKRKLEEGDMSVVEPGLFALANDEILANGNALALQGRLLTYSLDVTKNILHGRYQPRDYTFILLGITCSGFGIIAERDGEDLEAERWFRFAALFLTLAGDKEDGDCQLANAKAIFQRRYKKHNAEGSELQFAAVPKAGAPLSEIFVGVAEILLPKVTQVCDALERVVNAKAEGQS